MPHADEQAKILNIPNAEIPRVLDTIDNVGQLTVLSLLHSEGAI